ncbi:MAG: FHA domain-containing protein, partial [Pirellulaceae bacterium]|nr:FHA domain-containing protein [Pirellulaceae bacterium]
ISKRHAQIRRLLRHGVYQWMLEDLDSCNGTFVRVRRCRLKQGRKFQIGSRIFSVSFTQHDSKSDSTDSHGRVASLGTSLFAPALPGNEKPTRIALVECTRERKPMILELPSQECHLGSDGRVCQLIIDDDPWLDGRHVRFFIDAQNRWVIEDMASVNGLWVGIHAFRLRDRTWIQMGEQRLLFCAPLVLPSHTQS